MNTKPTNNKNWIFIKKDGESLNKSLLLIKDKRQREEIILYHFLKYYRFNIDSNFPQKIISRDNPHDFTLSSENGKKAFIEITAISNTDYGFQKQSIQKIIENSLKKEPLSIVGVLSHKASTDEVMNALKDLDKNPIINNLRELEKNIIDLFNELRASKKPILRKINDKNKLRILITDGDKIPLNTLIEKVIQKKEKKNYRNMEKMILIIDDQLIEYDVDDFIKSSNFFLTNKIKTKFKEIYLYSGRYSQLNGKDASFSIYPIKILTPL